MTLAPALQNADLLSQTASQEAPHRPTTPPPIQLHPDPEADPLPAELARNLSIVYDAGQYDDTSAACAKLLTAYRDSAFLWTLQGLCHLRRRALNDALTCLNRARELAPRQPDAYLGMADVYVQQNRAAEAETHFRMALNLDANHVMTLNNFANFLTACGRIDEAAPLLEAAVLRAPDNAILRYNLANAKRHLGETEIARKLYEEALERAPGLLEARYNLGQMLYLDRAYEAAAAQFGILLEANPEDDRARAYKLFVTAMLNDFSWVDDYQTHRRHLGLRGSPVSPFTALALEDNPDLLRLRTQAYASPIYCARLPAPSDRERPSIRPPRLRIGYFSADFHSHATMYLMAGLLREHDRSRFEIHAFSYGPERDDSQQALARTRVEHFHEVSGLSDQDLVALAREQQLDIAIDLKGFTGGTRAPLFAERLAPVQISYLGYPGSLGTPAIDYVITDNMVSPPGSERHFEEHLIRLPHSYQPNDDQRHIAPRQFTRADCGLPEEGFIFCCFNNSYKITPREFDVWMRLLSQVEGSVLWLLSSGPTSEANLRREAAARGVDPARLIFAERMAQDEHLARQKVADLFLDTFTVNAHTTCSDALWAGLPVLTLPGRQFAARVGASLVSAANLPELIADSEADYEARAYALAMDPEHLLSLRSKLMVNRRKAPLFDSAGYARHLEAAFDAAFERWRTGEAPTHLTLLANDHAQSGPASAVIAAE
jgi:predicted O-linked N-acetylglucosamine transferase (SPINDLY family)